MIVVHGIQERLLILSDAQRLQRAPRELVQTPCERFVLLVGYDFSQLATHVSKWHLLTHKQTVHFASANLLGDAWAHPAVRR